MNTRSLIATGMVCATVVAVAGFLSNAGPLSPPAGPIAPTNKTLDEVEPRIAVNAANTPGDATSLFVISQPGSYYLTGNITGVAAKNGISIASNNVTLDLNGFSLIGAPGSLNGIEMNFFQEGIIIRNGVVSGWGGAGVEARIDNGAIERIHARRNGGWGIDDSNSLSSRIAGCSALVNGSSAPGTGGIKTGSSATVESCQARNNTGEGIFAGDSSTVNNSVAEANTGVGIAANARSQVVNCIANGNGINGIQLEDEAKALNCTANSNVIDGIQCFLGASVEGCTVVSNQRDGVRATLGRATIRNSTAQFNTGQGFNLTGVGCLVAGAAAEANKGIGILAGNDATVADSTAEGNAAAGVVVGSGSQVVNSAAVGNIGGIGISAGSGSQVVNCVANQNSVNGIQLADNAKAINCTAQNNTFDGIHCFAGASVEGCTVVGNQRDGVRAANDRVSIRNCKADSNASVGINVNGAGCFVVGNYSTNHPTNYNLVGASLFGPVNTMATMPTNTNPAANYEGL